MNRSLPVQFFNITERLPLSKWEVFNRLIFTTPSSTSVGKSENIPSENIRLPTLRLVSSLTKGGYEKLATLPTVKFSTPLSENSDPAIFAGKEKQSREIPMWNDREYGLRMYE